MARVLDVIARLNVGGPAHHVTVASAGLARLGHETLLAAGRPAATEGSFDALAVHRGARLVRVPGLGPAVRPHQDVRALGALVRLMRRFRPDVVVTHTAKAGQLGRLAARLALGRDVRVVHTYHGHVLEGYFPPPVSRAWLELERAMARVSDALVAVSEATVADLVRLGVAPRERFRVVRLGLDLEPLVAAGRRPGAGEAFRHELGVPPGALLLGTVGRLVPVKRPDVLLRAFAAARAQGLDAWLAVVGDGDARAQAEALAGALGLRDRVRFTGFRTDLDRVLPALDLVLLTSDNEGTPVSLIEAAAAGRPALATAAGGVAEVVVPDGGELVPPGDAIAFAAALARLGADRPGLDAMGARAREAVVPRFAEARVLADLDALYRSLLRPAS